MTIEDRIEIACLINEGMSLSKIAKHLRRPRSAVTREVKRNSAMGEGEREFACPLRANGLCNRCMRRSCGKGRRVYEYLAAEEASTERRSSSRSGPRLPKEALDYIDAAVSEGVALGQSIHHIYASDQKLRGLASERTVRRLCVEGRLSTKPHQLRRYVRYKRAAPKDAAKHPVKDPKVLTGRTFSRYKEKVRRCPRANVAQYDSVIGKASDSKALLTVTFPKYAFQFGVLIDKGRAGSVLNAMKGVFGKVGAAAAARAFAINLADNGSEFATLYKMEEEGGRKVRSVFYTNPYRATDKAECERLHELVRYFLPKGHSLDSLTQDQVNEACSNINSYVRMSKGDRTPYDMVKRKFGKGFLDALGIARIPNKKVRLLAII